MDIIIIGRGGQGAVIASRLLGNAAFLQGMHAQAFPMFGVERRGAPVKAFCRISNKPILLRSEMEKEDFAIVLSSSLAKMAKAKKIFINSKKNIKNVECFDASSLALKIFGKDIVNTAIISFFCKKTGLIKKQNLVKACKEIFSSDILKKNLEIIEQVYKKFEK